MSNKRTLHFSAMLGLSALLLLFCLPPARQSAMLLCNRLFALSQVRNAYVYDFAQLVHTLGYDKVTIVAHSMGGNIALRYTGLYPDNVKKLVAIEGLGPSPRILAERAETPFAEHFRKWVDKKRQAETVKLTRGKVIGEIVEGNQTVAIV